MDMDGDGVITESDLIQFISYIIQDSHLDTS